MNKRLQRKVNFLYAYAIVNTVIILFVLSTSFRGDSDNPAFDEITVKRMNLISEKGELRMVLSNASRQHPGRINGQDFEKRDRPAGILFFNEEGDECGGIVYHGITEEGKTRSGMSFTMDQYKEDQVIQILNSETYADGSESIRRGILISDLPTGSNLIERLNKIDEIKEKLKTMSKDESEKLISEIGNSLGSRKRLFIGRTTNNNSGLFLSDPDGIQKLRIYVDQTGTPKFEVLDNSGSFVDILDNNQ